MSRSMCSHSANSSMVVHRDILFAHQKDLPMFRRTLSTLVALAVLSSGTVFSQQPTVFSQQSTEKQTGIIVLRMSGDLARKYAEISGPVDGDQVRGGLSISTTAVIVQHLENDQVRIEHSAPVKREGRPHRLVTLTATVDKEAIRSLVRTVFAASYSSPAAKEAGEIPTLSSPIHHSTPVLSLAALKGVKLRSWTLESKIGE